MLRRLKEVEAKNAPRFKALKDDSRWVWDYTKENDLGGLLPTKDSAGRCEGSWAEEHD